jgi:multidrug efflux pump subunit AcrB
MTSPSARVAVTSTQKSVARLKIFNYGDDPRVANEGDLLIVSENHLGEAGTQSAVQFEITIRGRDMAHFEEYVQKALALWNANKEYLLQPATRLLDPDAYVSRRGRKVAV